MSDKILIRTASQNVGKKYELAVGEDLPITALKAP